MRGEGGSLPSIIGLPAQGESAGGETFDGDTEVAVFPGDLPADAARAVRDRRAGFRGLTAGCAKRHRLPFRALPPAAA